MKEVPYLSQNELPELVKVGVFVGELKEIAKLTPNPSWKRLLNGAANYVHKVMMNRLECLDPAILERTRRKVESAKVTFSTYDLHRETTTNKDEVVIINNDDLVTLWMVVDNIACGHCKQTNVKGCPVRKSLHQTGCPVYTDNPAEGCCEFCHNTKVNDLNLDLEVDDNE